MTQRLPLAAQPTEKTARTEITDDDERTPAEADRHPDDGTDSVGELDSEVVANLPVAIVLAIALTWILAIGLAEYLTVRIDVRWGLVAHVGLLITAMIGAMLATWNSDVDGGGMPHEYRSLQANWCVAMALIPLYRIVALAMPLNAVVAPRRYGLIAIPLLIAAALAVRAGGYRRADVGLVIPWSWWRLLLTVATAAAGIGLGYGEFRVGSVAPLVAWSAPATQLVAAAALLVLAAFAEELVFRGVMQRAVSDLTGPVIGALYGATLYASLGVGGNRPNEAGLAFIGALVFAGSAVVTRSLLGVALARSIANICLLVLFPHFLQP